MCEAGEVTEAAPLAGDAHVAERRPAALKLLERLRTEVELRVVDALGVLDDPPSGIVVRNDVRNRLHHLDHAALEIFLKRDDPAAELVVLRIFHLASAGKALVQPFVMRRKRLADPVGDRHNRENFLVQRRATGAQPL